MGQVTDSSSLNNGLIIHQDAKINWVLEKRKEYSKRISSSNMGYRLLLYSGNKRQEAYNFLTSFKQLFPNLETYLSFNFPNFKLQGGDFKNKEDAFAVGEELKRMLQINPIPIPQKIDLSKAYSAN